MRVPDLVRDDTLSRRHDCLKSMKHLSSRFYDMFQGLMAEIYFVNVYKKLRFSYANAL